MPLGNAPLLIDAATMVASVMAGRSIDGQIALPRTVLSGPDDAIQLLERLATALQQWLVDLDSYSALTYKIVAHLRDTDANSDERQRAIATINFQTLVDAIADRPTDLKSRMSLKEIIANHKNRAHNAAKRLARRMLPITIPPRPVIWTNGAYSLTEATDPRHLQQDSAVLGHCVGIEPNIAAIKSLGLDEDDPRAPAFLPYWMKIQKHESRIFTLIDLDTPCATIEYNVALGAITQIQGNKDELNECDPFFPALCQALFHLKHRISLNSIEGFPRTPAGMFRARTGELIPATTSLLHQALMGSITLTEADAALLNHGNLWHLIACDISLLGQDSVEPLTAFAGTLRTSATRLCLPALRYADVHAPEARSVNLPAHESGNVHVDKTPALSLPRHREGNVSAASTDEVHLPHHAVGTVYAAAARAISLPSYRSGTLFARSAQSILLPLHRRGEIDAFSALSVSLPLHQYGGINAYSATDVFVPTHKRGVIHACSALRITAPASARNLIRCPSTADFESPRSQSWTRSVNLSHQPAPC